VISILADSLGSPVLCTDTRGFSAVGLYQSRDGKLKNIKLVILSRSEGSFLNLQRDPSLRLRMTQPTWLGFQKRL
jgi:hypothetical protein